MYKLITLLNSISKVLKLIMIKKLSDIIKNSSHAFKCANKSKTRMIYNLNIEIIDKTDTYNVRL